MGIFKISDYSLKQYELATNPCREAQKVMRSFYGNHKYQYGVQVAEDADFDPEISYKSQPTEVAWEDITIKRVNRLCHVTLTEKRSIKDGFFSVISTAKINRDSLIISFSESMDPLVLDTYREPAKEAVDQE